MVAINSLPDNVVGIYEDISNAYSLLSYSKNNFVRP